jgi:hypothetical protein
VESFARVGTTIVAGGSFTQVQSSARTTTYDCGRIVAFDETTGAISTTFAPNSNDQVYAVLAGPTPGDVYATGLFSTLNGAIASKIVLLKVSNDPGS